LAAYLGDAAISSVAANEGSGERISPVEWSDEARESERKIEDQIAACMRSEGFKYLPYLYEPAREKSKFDQAYALPPDEFAAQYGYGISTIDFEISRQRGEDPNHAIRDALSSQGEKAYDKAMNGLAGSAGGFVVVPQEGANVKDADLGCRAKAFQAEQSHLPYLNTGKFGSLIEDISALAKRIASDPRVSAAARQWSGCMADGGRTGMPKPADAPTEVGDRLDQLKAGGKSPKNVDPTKLAELRRFEIETAKLDRRCRKAGYNDAYKTTQYRLEEEFIKQHKAALDGYKDYASNEKGDK
jgi:hypothetical protein